MNLKKWSTPQICTLAVNETKTDLENPIFDQTPVFDESPMFDETPSITTGSAIGVGGGGGGGIMPLS